MIDKDQAARFLAKAHGETEQSIYKVVRVYSDNEASRDEPIKLLEVNAATVPSGIVPVEFGPGGADLPYPSTVIDVTPAEYEQIRNKQLRLPDGWRLGDVIFERTNGTRG